MTPGAVEDNDWFTTEETEVNSIIQNIVNETKMISLIGQLYTVMGYVSLVASRM